MSVYRGQSPTLIVGFFWLLFLFPLTWIESAGSPTFASACFCSMVLCGFGTAMVSTIHLRWADWSTLHPAVQAFPCSTLRRSLLELLGGSLAVLVHVGWFTILLCLLRHEFRSFTLLWTASLALLTAVGLQLWLSVLVRLPRALFLASALLLLISFLSSEWVESIFPRVPLRFLFFPVNSKTIAADVAEPASFLCSARSAVLYDLGLLLIVLSRGLGRKRGASGRLHHDEDRDSERRPCES